MVYQGVPPLYMNPESDQRIIVEMVIAGFLRCQRDMGIIEVGVIDSDPRVTPARRLSPRTAGGLSPHSRGTSRPFPVP
jgi:hypothetical protein